MESEVDKSKMRYVMYRDADGQYRWRLLGGNGEIICTGESHRDKTDVMRAIRLVKGTALVMVVDEQGMKLNRVGDAMPPHMQDAPEEADKGDQVS